MVCIGNVCINTLHKGAKDDDDDDADNNNNNNNNNNNFAELVTHTHKHNTPLVCTRVTYSAK
jgi:hypothetical protein